MGSLLTKPNSASAKSTAATKRALLVGCNYPNTKAQLKGCVNDVESWKQLLTKHFGFEPDNVKILVDEGTEHEPPTGKNIKRELSRLVAESQAGDIVFFHFSGHGIQLPANRFGDYEHDGLDEALVPTDMNVIVDDDLRDILSSLKSGVKFSMVADCCHSGGMLDHEQIAISGGAEMNSEMAKNAIRRVVSDQELLDEISALREGKERKSRALDFNTLIAVLQETYRQSKIKVDQKNIRSTLYALFGQDSSNAVLKDEPKDLTQDRAQRIRYAAPGKKPDNGLIDPDKGILITGCQSHETAADVIGMGGEGFGALSFILTTVLGRHKRKFGEKKPIKNFDSVLKTRQMLTENGYEQNPCLECSEDNAYSNFILW